MLKKTIEGGLVNFGKKGFHFLKVSRVGSSELYGRIIVSKIEVFFKAEHNVL